MPHDMTAKFRPLSRFGPACLLSRATVTAMLLTLAAAPGLFTAPASAAGTDSDSAGAVATQASPAAATAVVAGVVPVPALPAHAQAAGETAAAAVPELQDASIRLSRLTGIYLRDPAGKPWHPVSAPAEIKATVLIFALSDCPNANRMTPAINRLAKDFEGKGVRFFRVLPEPDLTYSKAAEHAREFDCGFPTLLDPDLTLSTAVGASTTPEAAIIVPPGYLAYRGRIDDRFSAPGQGRPEPEREDLRLALDAILSGHPAPEPVTKAIGCYLPNAKTAAAAPLPGTVTWNEHIAPILHQNCATCHRPDEIGPFPLLTAAQAAKRAKQITEAVVSRQMPPWHADRDSPAFINDRHLPDRDLALMEKWLAQGAQEGDPALAPPPPIFPNTLQIANPDATLTMPEPYPVPAEGRDEYRNFVFPLNLTEDKWVRSIELRPSARAVVHHVLVFLDTTGDAVKRDAQDPKPGYRGIINAGQQFLIAWAPGAGALTLPPDLAWHFPKGSSLVLQTHLHPSGKPEEESTIVRVKYAEGPPASTYTTIQLPPVFSILRGLEIPPGEKEHTMRDSFVLPVDVTAFACGAHAHMLGKRMSLTATLPDGTQRILLKISDWDFAWQEQYLYSQRIALPKGTRLDSEVVWDNSKDNPRNPTIPPVTVRWGEQTLDEMGSTVVAVIPRNAEENAELGRAIEEHIADQLVDLGIGKVKGPLPGGLNRAVELLKGAAKYLDANKDGVIDDTERLPLRSTVMGMGIPKAMRGSSP